jgi:beta-glucanase (GH16 family)
MKKITSYAYSALLCTTLITTGCQITYPSNPTDSTDSTDSTSTWQLIWADEFDDNSIDPAKWSYEVNCWGGGNNEKQCYTTQAKNAFVADGMLNIVALREDFTGPAVPEGFDGDTNATKTQPYTSARLRTKNKGDWRYGRIEARMKLPTGQGTWPAFWMLPTDDVYGGWPTSGEIDIIEAVNLGTATDSKDPERIGKTERRVHGTLHYGRAWPDNVYSGAEYWMPEGQSPDTGFHTYAIEWEDGEIRWYIDDVHYATQRANGWYSQYLNDSNELVNADGNAPFNERFHLILNLAVGGSWAGTVNDTGVNEAAFPQTMKVDYVRVYQCSQDAVTGHGCATIDNAENAELVEGNTPPDIIANVNLGTAARLTLFDDDLHGSLAYNSYNPDATISYSEVAEADHGEVLQITKTGDNGNVYFEYTPKVDLSQWQANGELVFDLKVISRAEGSNLDIKLDSGWPKASPYRVTLPALNTWTEVRIPLVDILANTNPYSPNDRADISSLLNLLVIEPTGAMTLQLDNIHYDASLANLNAVTLFDDRSYTPFEVVVFKQSGSITAEVVTANNPAHGAVVQFSYDSDEAVSYFGAMKDENGGSTSYDLSNFDNIEFDLLVVTDPRTTRIFNVKMDCGYPCTSGDLPIDTPVINQWTHYKIAISDLKNNAGSSLDLTKVDAPFVITPAWGNQSGVIMQLDNVKLTKN